MGVDLIPEHQESTDLLESQFCVSSHLTMPYLSFPVCKMGIIIPVLFQGE